MPIKIEKEPAEYYQNTGIYEDCAFECGNKTMYWHKNTPVCESCARQKDDKDVIELYY